MFKMGLLEAERAGWYIQEGQRESVGPGAALRDFSEYGAGQDDDDETPRAEAAPHVHIACLSDAIPPILMHATVQSELRRRIGEVWPPAEGWEDSCTGTFAQALLLVNALLRSVDTI